MSEPARKIIAPGLTWAQRDKIEGIRRLYGYKHFDNSRGADAIRYLLRIIDENLN